MRIGRLACEEHFHTNRQCITRWLDERGKDRLIAERAAAVRQRIEDRRKLRRMAIMLHRAFPVRSRRQVSFTLARHAAQFLRKMRNGGWIISPTPDGDWWVGSRRRSAAELVELAKAKGWQADLTADGQAGVDCAP